MWKRYIVYAALCAIYICTAGGKEFKNLDDTVLFKVNWPGASSLELLESRTDLEPYFITTANNEKYQCLIPDTTQQKQEYAEQYLGPNPMVILSLFFKQNKCSYRIGLYWTYELCHGRYVRQYHEERDGKNIKTQEYSLGVFTKEQKHKLLEEYRERDKNPNRKSEIPVKKVDGLSIPYLEIEMNDGTVCDLTNKPRKIRVLYVCHQHDKHDIFSLKETSSCEYEAIVLSPYLCDHPDYKPEDTAETEINCIPVDSAPKRPKALTAMELESLKLMHQKPPKVYAIFHVDKEDQDGEARVTMEIHPGDVMDKLNSVEDSINSLVDQEVSPAELNPIQNFLSEKNCLHGGNGWWKYEFCYGLSVVQYHIERNGTKTVISLGNFDKQKHIEWINAHPHKKPEALESRTHLSHFYSDGTVCDKTGNPRQTEVMLTCVMNPAVTSPSSVSLSLLESKTCEYILRVESPLICRILDYADENGLLGDTFEANFDKLGTPSFYVEQKDSGERIANEDD